MKLYWVQSFFIISDSFEFNGFSRHRCNENLSFWACEFNGFNRHRCNEDLSFWAFDSFKVSFAIGIYKNRQQDLKGRFIVLIFSCFNSLSLSLWYRSGCLRCFICVISVFLCGLTFASTKVKVYGSFWYLRKSILLLSGIEQSCFLKVFQRSSVFLVWVADIFCSSRANSLCSPFFAFCKLETLIFFVFVSETMIFPIGSLENPVPWRLVPY